MKMIKLIILLVLILLLKCGYTQEKPAAFIRRDTMLIAKLISFDSLIFKSNASRSGIKYYFGVRHLKLGIKQSEDSKIIDTIVVAYVYNKITESALCSRNFDLKDDSSYLFILGRFAPCSSDFPRIEGRCDSQGFFYPPSTTLAKKYKSIYRVINAVPSKRANSN